MVVAVVVIEDSLCMLINRSTNVNRMLFLFGMILLVVSFKKLCKVNLLTLIVLVKLMLLDLFRCQSQSLIVNVIQLDPLICINLSSSIDSDKG